MRDLHIEWGAGQFCAGNDYENGIDLIMPKILAEIRQEPDSSCRVRDLESRLAYMMAHNKLLKLNDEASSENVHILMEFLAVLLGDPSRSAQWGTVCDVLDELRAIDKLPEPAKARVRRAMRSLLLRDDGDDWYDGRGLLRWLKARRKEATGDA